MTPDRRQTRYAAHRRDWRDAHPPAECRDGTPALTLTPPPGPCERCGGSGEVIVQASDAVFAVTCGECGGAG